MVCGREPDHGEANRLLRRRGLAGGPPSSRLVGYLLSRDTSFGAFFDENWSLVLSATGLVVARPPCAGAGLALLYSTAGAFSGLTVPFALGISRRRRTSSGSVLAVIIHIGPAVQAASAA